MLNSRLGGARLHLDDAECLWVPAFAGMTFEN
jgi:hypothetical protein